MNSAITFVYFDGRGMGQVVLPVKLASIKRESIQLFTRKVLLVLRVILVWKQQ